MCPNHQFGKGRFQHLVALLGRLEGVRTTPEIRLLRRSKGRRSDLCLLWEVDQPSSPGRLGDRRMPKADIGGTLGDGEVGAKMGVGLPLH